MPRTQRPYGRESLDQLRRLVHTARRRVDAEGLRLVVHELGLRSTRAAARLLEEAQTALTSLGPRPESTVPGATGPGHRGMVLPLARTTPTAAPQGTPDPPGPPLEFDEEQRRVVNASADACLIVNAPPGTGKTAVACGRIASLLRRGVPPHSIWLVSFTRTAVAELRNRIGVLADADASVHSVVAGTVDSRAWRLLQGFTGDGQAALLGGYECTIAIATALLEQPTHDLRERLEEVLHLIVDEAQDLVGERARLLEALVRALPAESGVTVLCDEAQAIYGFSEEQDPGEGSTPSASFVATLRGMAGRSFSEVSLRTVHRTESLRLRELFVDGRAELLEAISERPGDAPDVVRRRIAALQDGHTTVVRDGAPADGELLLFRRRIEALDQATWLASGGRPFRLRTSGLPRCIHPWLGVMLGTWTGGRLTRDQFDERWALVSDSLGTLAPERDRAWRALHVAASDGGGVNLIQLRAILARAVPPDEFLMHEFGQSGPTFSTIHASKGREAAHVRLYLPAHVELEEALAAEEARVLFVGATRARATLRTCRAPSMRASYLPSGRTFRRVRGDATRAQIEIGRDRDLDPFALVCGSEPVAVERSQRFLRDSVFGRAIRCRAVRPPGTRGFRYELEPAPMPTAEGVRLGRLAPHLRIELYGVANQLWAERQLGLPSYIDNLYCVGARTVVATPDDPRLADACEPHATSGIWLAPLVVGLPMVPFFSRQA